MTIQEKISNYLDHFEDAEYVDSILKSMELEAVFDAIVAMLRSGQGKHINDAHLFIRDVILLIHTKETEVFKEEFYTSKIVEALNENVFANQHFVRSSAIYTIGKVWLKSSIDTLLRAFDHYLISDPVLLPELLFEIGWLGDRQNWDRIERMVRSDSYLTRWAALHDYSGLSGFIRLPQTQEEIQHSERQKYYLEILKQDNHPLIRADAEYKLRAFDYHQMIFSNKADQRKARKILDASAPVFDFDDISRDFFRLRFPNDQEYTVSELEDFVAHLQDSPR